MILNVMIGRIEENLISLPALDNGIALACGGTLLLSLPLPLVIAALQILEEPTGCSGIVEWELIGDVGDL
jgi:hypothetical protein